MPGPARFLGDVSYAVYLWHWPLVVVWPHVTGVPLRTLDKVAVLLLTVLLAWGTKVAVEDPVQEVFDLMWQPTYRPIEIV